VQVATAVDMLAALEARIEALRKQVLAAARHLTGAKVRAARLYGVGPVTALALTCWLGGADRFSSSRKAVRFTGLDITVWSSDRKGLPGRLSRQGPPVLRWAVSETGKTHARATAPDHGYYAQMKDRKNGKRRPVRSPQDRPAGLPYSGRTRRRGPRRRLTPPLSLPMAIQLRDTPVPGRHAAATITRWGPPRPVFGFLIAAIAVQLVLASVPH